MGRCTKISAARNPKLRGSVYTGSCSGNLAASTTNNADMSRTLRFSLNCTIRRTCTNRWLAKALPMTVTAKSPDSASTRFEAVNTTSTTTRVTWLRRKSGTQ